MGGHSSTIPSKPAAGLPRPNCRVYERHPCDLPSACQPPTVWGAQEFKWVAAIRDVSLGGVRLHLRRRFEQGAGLAIELPGPDEETPSVVLARVVHVHGQDDGSWVLGCSFVSRLSDEELNALLGLAESGEVGLFQDSSLEFGEPSPAAPAAVGPSSLVGRALASDVYFQGTFGGGAVVRRFIKRLALPRSWPLAGGQVISLQLPPDGRPVRLLVDFCGQLGGRWVLFCTFLDIKPGDVARFFGPDAAPA
ncbi:MAG TPA: PilZ domain-containing protein [Gemmataceae bacterium]|nr:PilZ domain-containing protein [Gemmataceae bacterium]